MKLRRIFAAIAACAIAATSVISASAADALLTITAEGSADGMVLKGDGNKEGTNGNYHFFDADIDVSKIDKIVISYEATNIDGEASCEIGANTIAKNAWDQITVKVKTGTSTVEWADIGGLMEGDDGIFQFGTGWIAPTNCVWDGSTCTASDKAEIKVTDVKYYDKDGKDLLAPAETPADPSSSEAPKDPSSTGAAGGTTNPTTGATAGLALAGLAIAGAAVVAAKKSK